MDRRATRRELVAGTVGAAVGAAFGAVPAGAAEAPDEVKLLVAALDVELLMVFAYERVFASGAFPPGASRAVAPHLSHERSHVSAVAAELNRLGFPASTTPMTLKRANAVLGMHQVSGSLTDLHTEHDCFKLLIDLESVAEGVHYTALKDLTDPALVRLAAQIMACEAQHWTVLSGLRNPGQYVKAVPWPYVFGSK
jgi:hypothetical protein